MVQAIRDIMYRVGKKDRVYSNGQMDPTIMVTSLRMLFMVQGNILDCY